jgi:hypothetical protein
MEAGGLGRGWMMNGRLVNVYRIVPTETSHFLKQQVQI